MDSDQNNTVHLTTSSRKERFVPTCSICGNKHWPRDPSCLGKKGAKAKAKAKASAKAKARAKRLGSVAPDAIQTSEAAPRIKHTPAPVIQPSATPAVLNVPTQSPKSPQSVDSGGFPPMQKTQIPPEPKQQGGERVVKIKAKSKKEITSFKDEITRIKRQADQVVLRTSEDAAHRIQSERTARKNAEAQARQESAARLVAEQKLQAETVKLKNLQEQARKAGQSSERKMQQFQQEFTDNTQIAAPQLQQPVVVLAKTNPSSVTPSRPSTPSNTISNVGTLLSIRARDIMETSITWANPEETISTVLDRMLAGNSHYAIVTADGKTEGVVSRTELTGPINECLVPFIAKWQRTDTDATFNVAVKWIMSKQISSISPDDSCTAIMKVMRSQNMSPLPVIEDGRTIGLVTPFNVFKIRALLKLESDNTASSNRQLIRALPARISSYMSALNTPQPQLVNVDR